MFDTCQLQPSRSESPASRQTAEVGDGWTDEPAGFNQNLGSFNLFPVTAAMPRGTYGFNCRIVNPVTGALMAEDLNSFEVH